MAAYRVGLGGTEPRRHNCQEVQEPNSESRVSIRLPALHSRISWNNWICLREQKPYLAYCRRKICDCVIELGMVCLRRGGGTIKHYYTFSSSVRKSLNSKFSVSYLVEWVRDLEGGEDAMSDLSRCGDVPSDAIHRVTRTGLWDNFFDPYIATCEHGFFLFPAEIGWLSFAY